MGLLLDLFFSSIGGAYLIYGKRQHSVPFLIPGFVLCIYPYFVSNMLVCALLGVALIATPFVYERVASS
ncbi:MAG: hypothetical protein ACXW3E_00245 [Thermoanaerobaculia bacterium]